MKNGCLFHPNYAAVSIAVYVSFESFCLSFCLRFLFLLGLGTHISNTGDAKAFALLSEEGIAKGIRRITAVTADRAYDAKKAADVFEQQVDDAEKLAGSLLEEVGVVCWFLYV